MNPNSNSRMPWPHYQANSRRTQSNVGNFSKHLQLTVIGVFTIVFFALPLSKARADVVIPRSQAAIEGNTSEGAAGMFGSNSYTNQIQIDASELSILGVQPGDRITGLRQRLDGTQSAGPPAGLTINDFEITLAEATRPILAMSTVYTDNMLNPVMVRDGQYTMPANGMPAGGSPNAFGALVGFDTPYTYQGGDLIIMLSRTAASSPLTIDSAANYAGAGTLYRILLNGNTFHASFGTLQAAMGIFQLQVNPVPEPTSLLLLLAGVTMFAARFRVIRTATCRTS